VEEDLEEKTIRKEGEESINHARLRQRTIDQEVMQNLLLQQDQYLQGCINEQENVLVNEIISTYCDVMKMRINQATLMAQLDSLLAAKSIDLEGCRAVVGHGETLILQECASIEVEVEETKLMVYQ